MGNIKQNKAIIIGASMAGLLAARSLADHFEQVTLLERDSFPSPGENRRGVPQGRHTHVLLEKGRQIMEDYLPGLTEELVRLSAVTVKDASLEIRWFHGDGFHKPGISGISGIGVSRPTLEAAVRSRVLALPNVDAVEECKVRALMTNEDNTRVTGVRLVNRQSGNTDETISADLVVDATGRGSRSPAWLEETGYQHPPVDEVEIGMGYTTRFFRREPEHIPGLNGISIIPNPPKRRMGIMLAQDGDRWVVTIGGFLGDHAPPDEKGFLQAARKLPTPQIYNVIKDAEPLTEPIAYKFPANLRRRYEQLERFPQGYLVFGDALCSFNPIYAQGMTVAAMEARALSECLENGNTDLARDFFTRASNIIDAPWDMAVGNDLNFPEVEGPRTPMVRFFNWYIDKVHHAAHHDAEVSIAFLKVINMVAPPPSILNPGIIWKVLKVNLATVSGRKAKRQEDKQKSVKEIQDEGIQYPRVQ